MSDNVISYENVRKNDYDFSFISTLLNLVGNEKFVKDKYSILCSDTENSNTYIWTTLSALGQQIGGVFNESIANFIDNISNVELCNVKALESLVNLLGVEYNVFSSIKDFPLEIIKLLDILSIKREYLLNVLKVDKTFQKFLFEQISAENIEIYSSIEDINNARIEYLDEDSTLSSKWQTIEISSTYYIDNDKLNNSISSIYKKLISDKITQTYNDTNYSQIYKVLSSYILLSNFVLPNSYANEISKLKTEYSIPISFDQEEEADNIENGISTIYNFSANEQAILQLEFKRRSDPYVKLEQQTRYKYYREVDVRNYYNFVKNQYSNEYKVYSNVSVYQADENYLQILPTTTSALELIDENCIINYNMIDAVAKILLNITTQLRIIREEIKSQIQKNYMRGTYSLISFLINEYLKNTVVPTLQTVIQDEDNRGKYDSIQKIEFDPDTTYNEIIEYLDSTQYFNISTEVDSLSDNVNDRYWEMQNTSLREFPVDTTNIFKLKQSIKIQNVVFAMEDIANFYRKTLNMTFDKNGSGNLRFNNKNQNSHLINFLSTVFDQGADNTYLDSYGQPQSLLDGKIQPYTWQMSALTIAEAYNDLSSYDVSSYTLSGTVQNQIDQLSTEFIKSRFDYFSNISSNLELEVRNNITSDINSQFFSTLNSISTTFIELVNNYSQKIYPIDTAYQNLAYNIVEYDKILKKSKEEILKNKNIVVPTNNANLTVVVTVDEYKKNDQTGSSTLVKNYSDKFSYSTNFTKENADDCMTKIKDKFVFFLSASFGESYIISGNSYFQFNYSNMLSSDLCALYQESNNTLFTDESLKNANITTKYIDNTEYATIDDVNLLSSSTLDLSAQLIELYNSNINGSATKISKIGIDSTSFDLMNYEFKPQITYSTVYFNGNVTIEQLSSSIKANTNYNELCIDVGNKLYKSTLYSVLNDVSMEKLRTFKNSVQSFLLSTFPIEGLALSVLNELSIYENILNDKNSLFYKYSGLSVGETPYYYISNTRHPSYQIHPCLSNFTEVDDFTYPIENTVTLVEENLALLLKNNVYEYFDKQGYLTAIWKNPLNVNSDYITRYEQSSHTNRLGLEDQVFGYDGLFYPNALCVFLEKPTSVISNLVTDTLVKNNYYKGLTLTQGDKDFIARQLQLFQTAIQIESTQKYTDIYRYGLDLYGNAYILVKTYSGVTSLDDIKYIDENTKKNTPGILWIKLKNHPFAFPAIIKSKKIVNENEVYEYSQYSQIYMPSNGEDPTLNTLLNSSELELEEIDNQLMYTPKFYDFTISKTQTILILNACLNSTNNTHLPIIVRPKNEYIAAKDRHVLKLLVDKKPTALFTIEQMKNQYSGFNFINYFNIGKYPGAIFYKESGYDPTLPNITFIAAWYDYSIRTLDDQSLHQIKPVTININNNLPLVDGTKICYDISPNSQYINSEILTLAYLTNSANKKNLVNYQGVKIKNYVSDLSTWIDTPSNQIVTKDFVVTKTEIYEKTGTDRIYTPYSDDGFNPLHENVINDQSNTQLPAELEKRGILKYQLIGQNKEKGINFKFVVPVRMYDSYTVQADTRYSGEPYQQKVGNSETYITAYYDNLSAADYTRQHFYEQNLDTVEELSDKQIYNLYDFRLLTGRTDLNIHIDEEYMNILRSKGYDTPDPDVDYPYLWRVNSFQHNGTNTIDPLNNFPTTYISAYDSSYKQYLNHEFTLNVIRNNDGDHKLSISWYYANGNIGIDINSKYFTEYDDYNIFNRRHKFLVLPKSGDGGVLKEWKTIDGSYKHVASYFIKNISDDKPRFLLSVAYDKNDLLQYANYITENTNKQLIVTHGLDNLALRTENRVLIPTNTSLTTDI